MQRRVRIKIVFIGSECTESFSLCVFLLIAAAVAVYWVWGWWILALVLAVISIPLPGIAVVIANGKGEPVDKRERNIYKPAAYREAVAQAHLNCCCWTALPDSRGNGPAALGSTPHEIVDITESEPPAER